MGNELSGESVTINIDKKDDLVRMQQNHGGWNDSMEECIGKECKLICHMGTEAFIQGPSGNKYLINAQLLSNFEVESKQNWKVGDEGIVLQDMNKVKELQHNHGGWVDSMKDALGKSVKVIKVWDDCDLQVTYGSKKWTLNKACLMENYKKVINDLEEIKSLQNNHGGWCNLMDDIAGKKVEIVCILEDGDCYVRYNQMEWMINPKCFVGKKEPPVYFKVGDIVEIDSDIEKVKRLQNGHGGWVSVMSSFCGKRGKVDIVLPSDLRIKFNQLVFVFNKKCVKLVEKDKTEKNVKFKPGDEIKIIGDKEKASELQKDHGGWSSGMELYLNKTGKVISIFPNGDLRVKVLGTKLTFNPKCCQKIADKNKEIPEIEINDDDDDDDDDNSSSTDRSSVELMTGSIEKLEFFMAIKVGDGMVKRDEKFEHFTAAHVAANEGHDHIIRILSNHKYKYDIGDKDGDTALHVAVKKNQNNCVMAILESGTDPNQENNDGITPLMMAVIVSYKDILQSLLNSTKIKINFRSEKCGTALHIAIKKSRSEEAIILINSGADLTTEDENKFHALHLAALVGSERILKKLLEKGPSALVDSQREDGFAAVHICAIYNHLNCMQLLINKSADLNIRTFIKQTALHIAVSQKHFDMVKLLVINKADPNLKDEFGDTPLHYAIKAYSVDQPVDEGGIDGLARLLQDSSKGPGKLDEIAVYLAQNGARLDIKNLIGQTPIDVCKNSSLQRKLIEILNPTKSKPIQLSMSPPKNELKEKIDDDVKDKSVKSEDEMICKICFANKADMAFGCGHMCCENCANNIMDCHVCRNKIVTRLKLYNY